MAYPILLIVGPAGSGKDTITGVLTKQVYGAKTIALATPLKEFAGHVFGFSKRQLYGPSEARAEEIANTAGTLLEFLERFNGPNVKWGFENTWVSTYFPNYEQGRSALSSWFLTHISGRETITARHVLQTLGTECARKVKPDIWINAALKKAKKMVEFEDTSLVIISDGRFRNEALKVKEAGGKILRIDSHDTGFTGNHQSEAEMKTIPRCWYDYEFTNPKDGLLMLSNHLYDAKILPYKA